MINSSRLLSRLSELGTIGALPHDGVERLALSEEDMKAREWLKERFDELGLEVYVDAVGNMLGIWRAKEETQSTLMIGSHLDTVKSGGRYDGSLGVLAALEVVQALKEEGIEPEVNMAVVNFTNEEGVRFTPDMMGSLYFAGGIGLEEVLKIKTHDTDTSLGEILTENGYSIEETQCPIKPIGYIEVHIEQGPILETEQVEIGLVENLQGIRWTEFQLEGSANHAGTTPMHMRNDAGWLAAAITTKVRKIAQKENGKGTVGVIELFPSQINATSSKARVTVDLRHPNAKSLRRMQKKLLTFIKKKKEKENITVTRKELVQFEPVEFSKKMVKEGISACENLNLSYRLMTSGAGHDAQMMQRICPSTMIFIPSKDGISHNPKEFSKDEDVIKGTLVLYEMVKSISQKKLFKQK